jgi:uridine kinase
MSSFDYDNLCSSKFGDSYDENSLYFISIQGPTSSGKSSLSNSIKSLLSSRKAYLIRLDDFYMIRDNAYEDVDNLDFDNPNILNWRNIYDVINSIIGKDALIPLYQRSTEACNKLTYVENIGYNLVIIEGLYAFNCLNEKIFNLKEFDIYDSDRYIENEYVENEQIIDYRSIGNGFKDIKFLNIMLTLCKSKMYSLKTKRDRISRNLPYQVILDRLNKFIWPDTLKWVYSEIFKHDIVIRHGNFNDFEITKLKKSLVKYFGCTQKSSDVFKDDLKREYLIDCSGECLLE